MKSKYLRIIAIVLIGVGAYFTLNQINISYQMESNGLTDDLAIVIIGAIFIIAWYFPFFIIVYWLADMPQDNNFGVIIVALVISVIFIMTLIIWMKKK